MADATTPAAAAADAVEGEPKCCCGHDAMHWIWWSFKLPLCLAVVALAILPFVIGVVGSLFAFPCRCEMMDCCQKHSDLPVIFSEWFRYPFWTWRWFYGKKLTSEEKKVCNRCRPCLAQRCCFAARC